LLPPENPPQLSTHGGQAKSSQNTAPRILLRCTTIEIRGSKPRGAEVNFTGAMRFYTIAKL
jgi:hypothetical protein